MSLIYAKKIEVFFKKEEEWILDGQSKMCNWLYNQFEIIVNSSTLQEFSWRVLFKKVIEFLIRNPLNHQNLIFYYLFRIGSFTNLKSFLQVNNFFL
jgi:hypothetical protein